MEFVEKGINYVKKICDDDEVCIMLAFVLVGFMLCYLFKNQISGYMDFKSVQSEFDPLIGGPNVIKYDPIDYQPRPPQQPKPQPVEQKIEVENVKNKHTKRNQMKKQGPVGLKLKARREPDPTPSTERQLGVMAAKPPVNGGGVQQMAGLQIQDATIFKPFDEVWNPGFMPLDMVFKGSPSQMAADRPTGHIGPKQQMGPATMPTKEINLVLVYAPWCGHSKNMLPDYERIKSEFDGQTINGKKINIIMYNSDVDKDKVKEYDVKGFPSLFFESDGRRESFPHREYSKIKAFLEGSPMPPKPPHMPPKPPPKAPPGPKAANEVNLVLVYAPWCGHSKKMLPDYEKIKSEFDGKTINGKKINIIMYNSDVDKDKVKEYQVEGFPTLFLEVNGNRETFPHREYSKIKTALESL